MAIKIIRTIEPKIKEIKKETESELEEEIHESEGGGFESFIESGVSAGELASVLSSGQEQETFAETVSSRGTRTEETGERVGYETVAGGTTSEDRLKYAETGGRARALTTPSLGIGGVRESRSGGFENPELARLRESGADRPYEEALFEQDVKVKRRLGHE